MVAELVINSRMQKQPLEYQNRLHELSFPTNQCVEGLNPRSSHFKGNEKVISNGNICREVKKCFETAN